MTTGAISGGIRELTYQGQGSSRCCCDEDSVYNPKPDKNGDYWSRNLCDKWIVVDSDGPLNGRMDFKFPFSTYDACNAVYPDKKDMDIDNWKTVTTFTMGSVLGAAMGNMGPIIVSDNHGHPWMLVKDTNQANPARVALVRANDDFIHPAMV